MKAKIIIIILMLLSAPALSRNVGPDGYDYLITEIPGWIAQHQGIPTDQKTWDSCCHHEHCQKVAAMVHGRRDNGDYIIQFHTWTPTIIEKEKVHESNDGNAWVCRKNRSEAPTNENLYCAFLPKNKPYV